MSDYLAELKQLILDGMEEEAEEITEQALSELEPARLITLVGEAADELGERFQSGAIFLPELICGAEAMNAVINRVIPRLLQGGGKLVATIVIGSVEGDIHDIGKRIVTAMLTGAGFKVVDLGVDVPVEKYIEAVKAEEPEIVAASAYITTTAPRLRDVEMALVEAGLRDRVRYLIGGAAVSTKMVELVGADGYGENAVDAVQEARRLISELKGS